MDLKMRMKMKMNKLTKKVVKKKHLQKTGKNLSVLIPMLWINDMEWNRETTLVLEFLPNRKTIIISEEIINEENSNIIPISD